MKIPAVRHALLLVLCAAFAGSASAGTTTHKVLVSSRRVPWTAPVIVPAFDTTLGALTGVELGVRARCVGSARYENLRLRPQIVQADFATFATLTLPSGEEALAPAAMMSFVDLLPAFDSVLDFEGRSGRRHDGVVGRLDSSRRLLAPATLAWFESSPDHPKRGVRLRIRVDGLSQATDEAAHAWESRAAMAIFVTYHFDDAR